MSHSTGAERAPLGNLKPGKISPRRPVPAHIDRPEYMYHSGPEVITASDIKKPSRKFVKPAKSRHRHSRRWGKQFVLG